MDGTDRNLEIPTRGAAASTNKRFHCYWGGDMETLGATGDSLVGARRSGRRSSLALTHTHARPP